MTPASHIKRITYACITLCALFLVFGQAFAQVYEEGSQYIDKDMGAIFSVPKQWKAKSDVRSSLSGGKTFHTRLVQKHEDGSSRTSIAVDVYAASLHTLFGIPDRLRGKISDADLVNFYIDFAGRTRNAYNVRKVRRDVLDGIPVFVVESTEKTSDKYLAHSTDYLFFWKDKAYVIEAWYLAFNADKKPILDGALRALHFIKD